MSEATPDEAPTERSWPLWEVFVRGKRGLSHVHVGSLHAPDAELALRNARDVYTRRQEGVSIWVVRADDVTASSPTEKDSFFDPAGRQDLPAPDVLRRARGCRVPVSEHVTEPVTEPAVGSFTPPARLRLGVRAA